MPLKLQELLNCFEFTADDWQKTGLREEDLQKIYDVHCAKTEELKRVGVSIVNRLREVRQVHSANYRPKDPEDLVGKIIRKKLPILRDETLLADSDATIVAGSKPIENYLIA